MCDDNDLDGLRSFLEFQTDADIVERELVRFRQTVCLNYYEASPNNCYIDPSGHEALDSGDGILQVQPDPQIDYYENLISGSEILAEYRAFPSSTTGLIILDFFGFTSDDFVGNTIEVSSEIINESFQLNGQNLSGRPHGYSVLYHTLSVLTKLNRDVSFQSEPAIFAEFEQKLEIVILPVDLQDRSTNDISVYLDEAIDHLRNFGIDRFVINMSFGLVPCPLLSIINAKSEESGIDFDFESYVFAFSEELIGISDSTNPRLPDPTIPSVRQVGRRLKEIFFGVAAHRASEETDELNNLLRDDGSITYIAASGNFGLGYPMFPGAWQQVTSVSAVDFDNSNAGDLTTMGGSVQFLKELSTSSESSEYASQGTSYATPIVSVFAALDMASQEPRCSYESPQLDHWDVVANRTQHQINFWLPNAVQNICQQTP